ncbi:MAG: hypothetical protein MJ085_02150 [Clostridia bacterium]|nr:hypothetical protein [Clostridia bacterium]
MKKWIAILLVFALALCMAACSAEGKKSIEDSTPADLELATVSIENATPADLEFATVNPEDVETNSAYVGYPEGDAVGVILNAPFDENEPTATVTWQEGDKDCLYIIPRYVGSRVKVFETDYLSTDGDIVLFSEPTYSLKAEDGCVIFTSLERPADICKYYVLITSPMNLTYGVYLTFNESGAPAMEVIGPEA